MRQFFMQGKAITTFSRFKEYFDPRDLLRDRELATGFLVQHRKWSSPMAYYHTEVLFQAVFSDRGDIPGFRAESYCENEFIYHGLQFSQAQLLKELFASGGAGLRQQLWDLAQSTGLENRDRQNLYLVLAATYFLAGKDLTTCPLTPEEAEEAWLRRKPEEKVRPYWLTFDDSGADIALEASEEPYRILMNGTARTLLLQGHPITHRKLIALPHPQGDAEVRLTLEFYQSPDAPPYQTAHIAVGDHRYFNFVKDQPVHFHPRGIRVRSDSGTVTTLERVGRDLLYTRGTAAPRTIPNEGGLEIYGFAPEPNKAGFILLTREGIKYNNYSGRNAPGLPRGDIVEVAFRGSECLLLDKHGHVHAINSCSTYPTPVICLADILRKVK